MKKQSATLLLAAGILLLLAGALLGFAKSWIFTGLLWSGALGCLAAALNFSSTKNDDDSPEE